MFGAAILLLPAIPLLAYPKEFPDTNAIRTRKQQEIDFAGGNENFDVGSMLSAVRDLLKNRLMILVNVATACEAAAVIGLSTFIQKIVHVQFHFTEGDASLIVGCIVIPGAAVGSFVGAYLVKRFDWNCKQILRYSSVMAFLSTFFTAVLLIGCGDGKDKAIASKYLSINSTTSCEARCDCDQAMYKPICNVNDGTVFYSPCHAGCFQNQLINNEYFNCSCFAQTLGRGVDGHCPQGSCPHFPLFAVSLIVAMLMIFTNDAPLLIISLRVVDPRQHTLALGIRQALMRLLGFVLGPILFGVVIDASCRVWKGSAEGGEGNNCLEYDDNHFRYYSFVCALILKLLSFVFVFVADKIYILPQNNGERERDVAVVVNMSVISSD